MRAVATGTKRSLAVRDWRFGMGSPIVTSGGDLEGAGLVSSLRRKHHGI
jgi:hypothetical protein